MCKVSLSAVILLVGVAGFAKADDQAEARAVLDRAMQATGGEATLSKIKAIRCKVQGAVYEGSKKVPMGFEWTYQGMDRMRTVSFDADGKNSTGIEVVNGRKGWWKDADKDPERLSKEQVESRRELMYANWAMMLVPLKGTGVRLSTLKGDDFLSRKAVGILVTHEKHGPLKLYFDKEKNLLVGYERPFHNVEAGRDFVEVTVYSDSRTVQGTKQPYQMTTFWDGVKVSDMRVTEFRLYERPLDEKLFSKP